MILERREEKNGIVVGCRNILRCPCIPLILKNGAVYFCKERDRMIISCDDCVVCPNCGMQPMFEAMDLIVTESPPVHHKRKVCPYCSHNRKGEITSHYEAEEKVSTGIPFCSVHRCQRRIYEGYQETIGDKSHGVCAFHRAQMDHWRTSRGVIEKIPLHLIDGVLMENLEYIRKRRGKGK
jgi:ribosome modulation factor